MGQRLGSSLYSLNNPMRQRLSIPISQMSKLRPWAVKQFAQGPDTSKWQRQDTNPDMSHKLSTTGPTASCRKGHWEPWKVLSRKLVMSSVLEIACGCITEGGLGPDSRCCHTILVAEPLP